MKKLITILTVALLLCGLTLSVSATKEETHDWADFGGITAGNTTPALSEDFSTLTVDGETYHRMDTSAFEFYYYTGEETLPLNETQRLQLKDATIGFYADKILAQVTLYYQDGAVLTADYVKDSQRDKLTAMLEDDSTIAEVEFWFGAGSNTAKAPIKDYKGTPTQLDKYILEYGSQFEVYSIRSDLDIRCQLGIVLEEDGKFYYADFAENDIIAYKYELWTYDTLKGYEITDEALVRQLEESTAVYYSDGVGALYDDDFTEVLSVAVLVLVFGILPGTVLILAVILLIRNKAYQRLTWAVTAGLAAGELAVFGALVVVFMGLISQ